MLRSRRIAEVDRPGDSLDARVKVIEIVRLNSDLTALGEDSVRCENLARHDGHGLR